jgi:putative transposase
MPRKARIDAPGALNHIIVRGIARGSIFDDDADRDFFIERLGAIISDTQTKCFAWALIPNHFHLLLKTGLTPISTVMKRLLTGYAMYYNRTHHRSGHLFQNRYKSILCQEDIYLLELVRYIHLNPLRAGLVMDITSLDNYPYSGHGTLMGKTSVDWQDTTYVLTLFHDRISSAQRRYWDFVKRGLRDGNKPELTGGGLIRSMGGWSAVKSMRKGDALQKGDERILGQGGFVENVLSQAKESLQEKYCLRIKGITIEQIAERAAQIVGVPTADVWLSGKQPQRVQVRDLICYWATDKLGITQAWLSEKYKISQSAVSHSVERGRKLVAEMDCTLGNL